MLGDVLRQLQDDIASDVSPEEIRIKYLGKNGIVNSQAKLIKNLNTPDEKRRFGQQLNELKNKSEQLIGNYQVQASDSLDMSDWTDISIPPETLDGGSLHPSTHAIHEIADIFTELGFIVRSYRETDNDWYPFEGLNMSKNHPARDEWETFFLEDGFVLTPHTSNGQLREMKNQKPPIKMINISKTYRRQSSPKHSPMFHQFEGLYIDEKVSIAHLKGTIEYFIRRFFGADRTTRIRPYHFKFTEPSFEIDVICNKCWGKGCNVCKMGWLEIGGAGMVHPRVLKNGGINPEQFSGFAFGFGVERPYMMKGDIKIPDIRLFYSGDMRFLRYF